MMKKYLMAGVAALTMGAALSSCSHDEGFSSVEELKAYQYEQAFVSTFGKIDRNQTWGFAEANKARTRTSVNVNGNLWEEMPSVSPEEKQMVFAYVNMTRPAMKAAGHKYTEQFPENLENYWVSQVWTGTDEYTNFEESKTFVGSSKMNNLQIAHNAGASIDEWGNLSEGDWYHVNNFNRGDNTDWSGNTLIANSGTHDFAYHGAEDSKYHNKWIAVKGGDIDESLEGYYYICFDHVAIPNDCQTIFEAGDGSKRYVDGAYKTAAEAIAAGEKAYTLEWDATTGKNYKQYVEISAGWKWTQVVSGNQFVAPNDVYTDWIIRLVAAKPAEQDTRTLKASGRIFCEDLGTIGDFDFNDVVFDAWLYDNGDVEIDVLAAGGTLPIAVAGETITLGKMTNTGVNTNSNKQHITVKATSYQTLNDIPVTVSQSNNAVIVLQAQKGKAPQKFCAPIGTKWVDEYVSIVNAYPNFKNWVNDGTNNADWYNNVVNIYVDLNLENNENAVKNEDAEE